MRPTVLLWSLLLAAPAAPALADGSAQVDYLRRLQIELVRQQAFTSAKTVVSKNYGAAASQMKTAIAEGQLGKAMSIYAEAVKFEGRVRMGLANAGSANPLRLLHDAGLDTRAATQRGYDLKRAVWLFSRDGLLPNQQVEKQALTLLGAHELATMGKLKLGRSKKTSTNKARDKARAAGKKPDAWPMRYSLYHLAKRALRLYVPVVGKGRHR